MAWQIRNLETKRSKVVSRERLGSIVSPDRATEVWGSGVVMWAVSPATDFHWSAGHPLVHRNFFHVSTFLQESIT